MLSLVLAALPCLAPAKAQPLDWMAGHWVQDGNIGYTEERWTPSAGGHLLGLNRHVQNGKQLNYEFMRIEPQTDRIVYHAQPAGQPATPFCLAKSGPKSAVFVNPAHDFPQRIEYVRTGRQMRVNVSGGGKTFSLVLVLQP